MAHIVGLPDRVIGEEAGRRQAAPASCARTRTSEKPDATAHCGDHRALRGQQTGKREYRIVPLRTRHYADRFQDRPYRHRLQEDAGNEVTRFSLCDLCLLCGSGD